MNSLRLRVRTLPQRKLASAAILALLVSQTALAQEQLAATAGSSDPVPAAEVPVTPATAPATTPSTPTDTPTPQDKRIMGVLPNYRTADGTLPFHPITAKYKLTIAAKDSFDWPNYIIGGIFAGLGQADNSHPSFGQGVVGFAHRYGTSYADQVIGNMLTEGFMPIAFHEDPRYFRKVHGSVARRLGYSLTRVLITKTDSGRTTFNFAEVVGNGMGASIANLYYADERGFSDTLSRMATQIATDSLSNLLKEFWPDIKRRIHKNKVDPALTSSH
jgi:hypothetical protein